MSELVLIVPFVCLGEHVVVLRDAIVHAALAGSHEPPRNAGEQTFRSGGCAGDDRAHAHCELLLARVASWIEPHATLFVHIFTHRHYAYPFEARDESDWMARYFFTGGIIPSRDPLLYFQRDVRLADDWQVCGRHGQTTRWWVYWLSGRTGLARLALPLREALGSLSRCRGVRSSGSQP